MPPRRRAPVPITLDVEAVRRKLADGKIVRVGISKSAQFPEGGTGRVRHVGDPAVDGDEFVKVELSLNGTRDILPFTPADLTPATRARPDTDPAAPQPPARARATRTTVSSASTAQTIPLLEIPSPRPGRSSTPTGTSPSPASPPPADPPPAEPARTTSSAGATSAVTNRTKPARSARRSPPVSITIATTDPEPTQWRIEARVGARVVLRHGSVSPARVWDLVRQLDEPTLSTAVGGILDEQRKATQARADVLAAELAQVRAELAALPKNS